MTTRILCAGTFDIVHTGHVAYLKAAKALAQDAELIVIVARDINSNSIKKKPTINNEQSRLSKIKSLDFVNQAVLGKEKSRMLDTVVELHPDIIALGHDQWPNEQKLKEDLKQKGLNVKIVRMPKFEKKQL